jgi:Kef-type K+ transport system membrane component KefB
MEEIFVSPEFQMSLLLFIALAGYLIASRINQSAVVGLILIGILVGPSFLNLINYSDFVSSLARLGAVILLFVIGMEFKIRDIMVPRNGLIALSGVILPWLGGFILSELYGYPLAGSIFIGTALTATSIAITANVLRECNSLNTDAAKAIIGAAVIDDILSLMALAMSSDVVAGSISFAGIALVTVKAVLFIAISAAVGLLVVSRLIEYLDQTVFARNYPEFTFIFAMMMAFFYALIAELVGLSAIVGAFIAGVSFSGIVLRQSKSFKEGAEYLQIIFASIFFVSLGVIADFHALTPDIAVFVIILTLVAILTKVLGCGIPAYMSGMSRKDSLIIGFGMSPRGEVAMIVALIGLQSGVIDQGLYVTIVLMALLTTLITPLIYRNWLFCRDRPEAYALK